MPTKRGQGPKKRRKLTCSLGHAPRPLAHGLSLCFEPTQARRPQTEVPRRDREARRNRRQKGCAARSANREKRDAPRDPRRGKHGRTFDAVEGARDAAEWTEEARNRG